MKVWNKKKWWSGSFIYIYMFAPLCGWISVMFIGNITGGQISYLRRDCIWHQDISYLKNFMGMRLLEKAQHRSFSICTIYFCLLSPVLWDTYRLYVEHIFTDYLSITPSLDQVFGFLLCSLGTLMTVLDCLLMRGFS